MKSLDEQSLSEQEKFQFLKTAAQTKLLNCAQILKPSYEATWYLELIAEHLEDALLAVKEKRKKRIILTMPPRHGKTELASMYFPAWALGKSQDIQIILSTYGADLSEKIGMKTRDIIASEGYQAIFPGVELRQDQKAKAKWQTNKGGSFTAVGVGGAVTGIGGNCITGETEVITETGKMRIDTLVHLQHHPRVLSYNHETNVVEWKKILAVSEREVQDTAFITTSGGSILRCTDDHRIFTKSRGYLEARLLAGNEKIITLKQEMCNLQKGSGKKLSLSRLLVWIKKNTDTTKVLPLWKRIYSSKIRCRKTNNKKEQGFLLFKKMFVRTSFFQKQKKVQKMWEINTKKNIRILLDGMQDFFKHTKKVAGYPMWALSYGVSSPQQQNSFLQHEMQKQPSFKKNDGERKFKTSSWSKIQFYISRNASKNNSNRWRKVCSVQDNKIETNEVSRSTSHRRRHKEQQGKQPDNALRWMPHDSPQISEDTISVVSKICGRTKVYDIQVEDNHNFFANDILVHNCIILDDPHKSREEAESLNARDVVWEYYRDTLYSRLEGFGVVIVIMQRWHADDIIGRILEDSERRKVANEPYDEWEVINFPAIAEQDEYHKGKLMRKAGEALWPAKFPLPVLENIRAQSVYKWAGQYQQDPILAESQEFNDSMFKYFEEEELRGKYLRYYTLIDPAISQKTSADNTVVLTVAKEVNGPNWYRIREDAAHLTPRETVDLIFVHQNQYNSSVHLETVAYQEALKYSILEEQKLRQKYFIVNEMKTNSNKEMRIRGLLPLYMNGVIYHRHTDTEYERELLSFPRGKRDDRIDAMAMGIKAIENTGHGNIKQTRSKFKGYFRRK